MKVLEVGGGEDSTTAQMDLMPLNCTLKSSQNGKFYVMHILPQLEQLQFKYGSRYKKITIK